jgi:hypothetical protein
MKNRRTGKAATPVYKASFKIIVENSYCQEEFFFQSAQNCRHLRHLLKQYFEAVTISLFWQITIIFLQLSLAQKI